jgi:hypothetical protein
MQGQSVFQVEVVTVQDTSALQIDLLVDGEEIRNQRLNLLCYFFLVLALLCDTVTGGRGKAIPVRIPITVAFMRK